MVGWEQSVTDEYSIPTALTESESGLYFQQAHPLLTIDNVKATLPRFDVSNIADFDLTKSYHVGDKVVYNGSVYINRLDCVGISPDYSDFNPDYNDDYGSVFWEEYDQLSEFLKGATNAGIAKVANEFMAHKSVEGSSKSLFDHKCFFDGAGRIKNRVVNTHSLVGYEIQPMRGMGVTTQIHKIGLQMTGANGVVRLYLFHSSQEEPVKTFDLRILKNGGYSWFPVSEVYLPYMGENTVGGAWFLCYEQDALPEDMEAVNISKDWSREPCSNCNVGSVEDWRVMNRYIKVSPFRVQVDSTFTKHPTMFDVAEIDYTPGTCYGLNCEISIGCDLTDFIIAQRGLFASVLQKQVCYDLLKRMAYNPEVNVNRNQSNVARQQDIIFELDGNTYTRSGGIRGDLKKAYDAIDIDTQNLDSACLACKRKGVRYRMA